MPTLNRPFAQRAKRGNVANRGSDTTVLQPDIAHDYRRKVGAFLARARLHRELTQAALGELVGMGFTAISSIEVGRTSVPPERYEAFAAALGLDHEEWGRFVLRHSNPWAYRLIFSKDMSKAELAQLDKELGGLPDRLPPPTGGMIQ